MVPRCSLFPEGTGILSADVFHALDRPDRLEIEFHQDGGRPNRADPSPGSPIDFWIGDRKLFSGLVERSGLRLDRTSLRGSLVAYASYERRRRLRFQDRYYQMSDAEIATRIARELGLTPMVENTREVYQRLERRGDPLRFLRELARERGFEVAVTEGVLYFAKHLPSREPMPRLIEVSDGVIRLEIEARPEREGELQVAGSAVWRPLVDFELSGAGSSWDGLYRVLRSRHSFDLTGYRTVLEFQETRERNSNIPVRITGGRGS